ncbi:hypothetical protein A0H81_09298 [Grifola frondosa]|uniref:Uncharacterized protein n=1 Tax=Grifola frondosa TaxID=5627 RepID=A0A1C7M7K7_GRIFR|nr:hypothetical protein A0H81_09298 [Grifola frondosa]
MLVGTFPTFYKIRVTAALSHAVIDGTYPPTATIVDRYIPKTPRGQSEGMKPLDNRIAILRHFEAFEQFVVETELIVSTYVLLMYLDVGPILLAERARPTENKVRGHA